MGEGLREAFQHLLQQIQHMECLNSSIYVQRHNEFRRIDFGKIQCKISTTLLRQFILTDIDRATLR